MPKKKETRTHQRNNRERSYTRAEVIHSIQTSSFFGKLNEDVDFWIDDFDRIARTNFRSDGRKCVAITAFLRDQAADYQELLDDDLKDEYRSVPRKELQSVLFKTRWMQTSTDRNC